MDRTLELISLAKEGNLEARNQVAQENLGLVWSIVRRFANRGHELEDLYQIGCIGLLKSIDNFDLQYDVKFSTYAVPLIMGEIKRFLRDDNYIKVSRSLKELAYKIRQMQETMVKQSGEEPGIEELAIALQVEKEDVILALEATREVESIYKTIYSSNGDELLLMDKMIGSSDESKGIIEHMTIHSLLECLEPFEKSLIEMRYFEDMTQTDIGKKMGISQVQVSRMEKRVLQKMRERMHE